MRNQGSSRPVRIIAKRALREFWTRHAGAEQPLLAWYREVEKEDWDRPAKLKARYPNASFIGRDRVVFRVKGNSFRLVARLNYQRRIVYIRFIGTHPEYDRVNAEEV